jgi:hypothetical protein
MPQEQTESPDRVRGWLKELDINSFDAAVGESNSDHHNQEKIAPTTPQRQLYTSTAAFEEVSPTDTLFSGHSIFEASLRKWHQDGSPVRKYQLEEELSDITSIDSEEYEPSKKPLLNPPTAPDFGQRANPSNVSHDSQDAVSALADDRDKTVVGILEQTSAPVAPLHDHNTHRLVWIVSCLQCTLANLSCSRTHPCCTRCTRKGHSSECLLYRRWFASESLNASMAYRSGTPILLKVRGEDEALWQRKVELEKELCAEWAAGQDRKNWVMPGVDGVRGGWPVVRGRNVVHPGEGKGRMSFSELVIDESVEM